MTVKGVGVGGWFGSKVKEVLPLGKFSAANSLDLSVTNVCVQVVLSNTYPVTRRFVVELYNVQ